MNPDERITALLDENAGLREQLADATTENATYRHFMSTLVTQFAIQDPTATFDTVFGVFAKALGGKP